MKNNIIISDLVINDKLGYGASGEVFKCEYQDKEYAFKRLTCDEQYKKFIQPRLETISKFYGDSRFVFPHNFVYNNQDEKLFSGYTMDFVSGYEKLCDLKLDYKGKIEILMKARELLDILHKDYKHIHTDINPWNFLYNDTSKKMVLIDFDTCIDLKQKDTISTESLNTFAQIFCKYKGVGIDLDIVMFNLLTFSILNDVPFYDVIDYIFEGKYGCIESSSAREILSAYDDIEYNTLKREYVIDHL